MLELRDATEADVEALVPNLRATDLAEVAAGTGRAPREVLADGVRLGGALAVVVNGELVAIAGCHAEPENGIGCPWMLGTDGVERHAFEFLRASRRVVRDWCRRYGYLLNFVHADHEVSIRWLQWLGFTVDDPHPLGVRGELFRPFWMQQDV